MCREMNGDERIESYYSVSGVDLEEKEKIVMARDLYISRALTNGICSVRESPEIDNGDYNLRLPFQMKKSDDK